MEIAGHLQWFVPLAVVLVGALISLTRSVISYETTFSVFNRIEEPESFRGLGRLGAVQIRIKNTSHRHLKNVKLSFDNVEVVAFGKFAGSTLGQIQLPKLKEDLNLEMMLAEMPSLEIVTLDLLYANASLLGFARVSGGGNLYRLCERDLYRLERRSFWLQVAVVALVGFFVTWLVLQSLR